MSPRIVLNMIVKNEMVNLERAFNSVREHITAAVIYDTGSDDGTPKFCQEYFKGHKIPCRVYYGVFKDFSQARNAALVFARQIPNWDYVLLMDADMELVVDAPLPLLTHDCYALVQRQGNLSYHNSRLLSCRSKALYHGVTHEYLDTAQSTLPGNPWWFKDHATGSNRGDKYERDVRLLTEYLKQHPGDARSLFYLAQTNRDKGEYDIAIDYYDQRIEAGGWEEEVWYSKLSIARCYRALGEEANFIATALDAYNYRPIRSEPLYDLARHFREKPHAQNTSWLFADAGSKIKRPDDFLFVEDMPYQWGFREEKSIVGAYNDRTKKEAFNECDKLSLDPNVPAETREGARRNLYWYLRPLKDYAKSFLPVCIPQVNPDSVYTNSNPSVAVVDNKIMAIVRTVSYRILEDGRYYYNGLPSIRTTNYLAEFDLTFKIGKAVELQRPTGFPEPVSTEVLDIEDMRLFEDKGELWANGCVLEQNPSCYREQFIMRLNPDTGEVDKWRRMEPQGLPKFNEKNWMPIAGKGAMFMYRPGTVIDGCGYVNQSNTNKLAVDQFSGGGQVVPFEGGWLAVIHEARPNPTTGKRFYQHRFVWFDQYKLDLKKVSPPFVFFDRQIEFAAGLAVHPCGDCFIISFGVRDCEAWLAVISFTDVRELLWHP